MNYQNPTNLQAVILDWAGTVVDFGSFAPTQIFVEAFAEFDVQVSIEEARGPMGMGKWDHIRTSNSANASTKICVGANKPKSTTVPAQSRITACRLVGF